MKDQVGGAWPDENQELLLRAALLSGETALNAWEEWRVTFDVTDTIAPSTFRMLPILGRNLENLGVGDALLGKLKGVAKRTWVENQTRFRSAEEFASRCGQQFPVVWLRGAALVANHYRDAGLCVMSNVDLMIPPKHAAEAARLLLELGWQPGHHPWDQVLRQLESPVYQACFCASGFQNESGMRLNLHWQLYPNSGTPDESPWRRAVQATLGEHEVQVLSPADLLLHTIATDLRWQPIPPLSWIADCMFILRTTPEMDWHHALTQARRYNLVPDLDAALRYLATYLDAPVPGEVLDALKTDLARVVSSTRDRFELKLTQPQGETLPLHHYHRYLALQREPNASLKSISYNSFLQHYWGLDHVWQVPLYSASRLVHRWRR